MAIKHSQIVNKQIRCDGDIDAVVIAIDTGETIEQVDDRYKQVISHGLGRTPIGCQVIMSDKFTHCRVLQADATKLVVQFQAKRAKVNLRIW